MSLSLSPYLRLMRFDKPIGIFLLLWPTWWAILIASNGQLSIKTIFIFTLGVVIMRAAGCVINDLADRNFDGRVQRTAQRPLAQGEVSIRAAFILFIGLSFLAAILALALNRQAQLLAVLGLGLAIFYPFSKRFLSCPQAVLSLAFAWPILMVFAAENHRLPLISYLLFIATASWIIAYDTLYAMVDREDDREIGIHSAALWVGDYDKFFVGLTQLISLILWGLIGYLLQFKLVYFLSLTGVALLIIYQQKLIAHRQREQCFKAFLNNNWVGCIIFIGLLWNYLTQIKFKH